ncbi:unnamed protein product [Fraxinus pennsylvanica]|uniref:Uncharacterized protein n=1 Tax=Fraxinus pennsylvanica TaxID=56036 RepID=A0AAD1ZU39_9LAMI|nr:unnamed protein product [Fraxinus pennsylvanica]
MTTFRAAFKKSQLFPKSLATQTVNLSTALTKQSKSFVGIAENFKRSTTFSGNYISVLSDHLKNQRLHEARALFDKIPSPDVRLLTKMISCYVENCRLEEALKLFDKMPVKDTVLWNLMIKGCIDYGNLELGLRLFSEMPEKNVISWTTVMNGLLKFGRVEEAEGLFEEMPARDIAAWNTMVHGYFENGRMEEALKLFDVMPNRNVISWTSIISGLDQHGRSSEALSIFWKMVGLGMRPTSSTFACAITACANVGELCLGSQVHGHVMKLGCVFDVYVIASLITLYANCKEMNNSFKVFDEKLYMNVVTWTSLLTGYGVNSKHEDALKVFGDMIRMGVIPNQSSFTSALNSCCEMKAIDWGKEIHGAAIKLGFERDVYVGNTLVLLYTACGNISNGLSKFNEIAEKNIVSWNTIIVGCRTPKGRTLCYQSNRVDPDARMSRIEEAIEKLYASNQLANLLDQLSFFCNERLVKMALVAHFPNSSLMNKDKRCRPILFNSEGSGSGIIIQEHPPSSSLNTQVSQPNGSSPENSLGSMREPKQEHVVLLAVPYI